VVKPAAFAYHEAQSVEEALALLADLGDDAKVLAGGQSLVPMMNFRLARPAALVDLNRVAALSYLRTDQGTLRIGAMTRQRAIERSEVVARGWPLLPQAVRMIGHTQIRNRGTVGGSLAHADPAAELPAVITALEAEMLIRGSAGQRVARPEDFFQGYYATSLAADEILVEVRVPGVPLRTGWAFREVSRRQGDFALVGVAALLTLDVDGTITGARLAFTGAAPTPIRTRDAEAALVGQRPGVALFAEAGETATRDLDPETDLHATAAYRRKVAAVLARRALLDATERAVAST
jgi:carbon-monoxide dehydrogenase medium subunit